MARARTVLLPIATLALATACASAHADRIAEPNAYRMPVPEPAESPYQVDLITENGQALNTYQHRGRFYVLGAAGQRYSIRVTNPTNRRVEAVISVDGLDVIDGETASLAKRGYIVPAHGHLKVDGFRVSTQQVAAFRFSSVRDSYAGRKGKDRNVGVVGVAIFDEQASQEVIVTQEHRRDRYRNYDPPAEPDYDYDEAEALGGEAYDDDGAADKAPPARNRGGAGGRAHRRPATGSVTEGAPAPDDYRCCAKPKKERPGLGTKFGERRYSNVSFTRFVRNSAKPIAMAELRYNDAAGLQALGIQVQPYDHEEVVTRETADPWPNRFAEPPR